MKSHLLFLLILPACAFARLNRNQPTNIPIFFLKKTGWRLLHGDQTLQKANGKIHYWEIWEEAEQNKLFIHLGLLGKRGEAFENATAQFTVATSAQDQPE